MMILNLRKNCDRKVFDQHPWILKKEFENAEDNISSERLIEVRTSDQKFVARGFVNPKSFFYFRALSFDSREKIEDKKSFFKKRLIEAAEIRKKIGYQHSFRWVFSENDFLPGLVIDYFLVESESLHSAVVVIQITSLGINYFLSQPLAQFKEIIDELFVSQILQAPWERTCLIFRNDNKIREKEGLPVGPTQILNSNESMNLESTKIVVSGFSGTLKFLVNFPVGQKTGFFLDQNNNIMVLQKILTTWIKNYGERSFRVLDLCCHLGQWGLQIAKTLEEMKIDYAVTCLDISEQSIEYVKKNSEINNLRIETVVADVMSDSFSLENDSYDLIIVDPPAFAKSKDHLPTAKQAYTKLNAKAARAVKRGGLLVSCSCSAALSFEDFKKSVNASVIKSFKRGQVLSMQHHASDHPTLLGFPEGEYLKMIIQTLA